MDLSKYEKLIDDAKVIEELDLLVDKVFKTKNEDIVKVIRIFLTRAYMMGKKNLTKVVEVDSGPVSLDIIDNKVTEKKETEDSVCIDT